MYWWLESSFVRDLRAKISRYQPSAAQREAFKAEHDERRVPVDGRSEAPRNLKIAGDVAEISISGVLTKKPDFFLWFFGVSQTSYESIQSALAMAEADPAVKRVVLNVDSPGGNVDGLFDTLAALDAFTKPISTKASLAASAAYAIAAMGGKIEALTAASTFGSIGVVATYFLDDETVDITSTEAPNKRPDPSTPEGQAVIREHLDAIHDLMVDAIAKGRGKDAETINAKFGGGKVFLAEEAKKRGMVDKIAKPALRAVPVEVIDDPTAKTPEPVRGSGSTPVVKATQANRTSKMTKEELKAQHPDLYAAVLNEGKELGAKAAEETTLKAERDRVESFLIAGEGSGDMKTALEAIRAGTQMTGALQTKFLFAGRNKGDVDARQAESDAANKALEGSPEAASQDIETQTAALVEKRFGKK